MLVVVSGPARAGVDDAAARRGRPRGGHRHGTQRRPGGATVRRAAKGTGAQGLDAVGVAPTAEAAARGVGSRRQPAGVGAKHRPGHSARTDGRGAPGQSASRRPGPTARTRIRRDDALRRRKRSGRRLRLRERDRKQPAHRRGRPAGCPQPRSGWGIRSRPEERRGGTRWRRVLLDRFDGQRHRRRPQREPAARHHHAGAARRRPGAAVRHRGAQWHRLGDRPRRCGVDGGQQPGQRAGSRSGPVLRPGRARLRRRTSAGICREADARSRIGLAVLQSRWRTGQPAA